MLHDVVVVELGQRAAVAHGGKLLTDAGATVVVVGREPSEPAERATDRGAYLDAGKHMAWPAADGRLDPQLSARVDAVLHDNSAGTAEQIAQLREANPALVVVSVTDYGRTGPHSDSAATEFTLQAESGLTKLHPTGDRPPVWAGVELVELTGSLQAACAVVQGVLSVAAGADRGLDLDVSCFESAIGIMLYPWLYESIPGHSPFTSPVTITPGVEEAADGWVCIVALTPDQWTGVKKMVGDPALDDARFDTPSTRTANANHLRALLRAYTRRFTVAELVETGPRFRVPITPVATPRTLPELPAYRDRDTYLRNEHAGFLQPRPPFRWTPGEGGDGAAGPDWRAGPPPSGRRANDGPLTLPDRQPPRIRPAGATATSPLAGLRVLELGLFHAGPLVSHQLAALGADVIKVESVNRPDLIRLIGMPPTTPRFWEQSAAFLAANLGKRAITADLATDEGLEIVRRLIATCDVVVENYAPRTLERRGLDYTGLRAIRRDLVVLRMPAWGLTGPWRDRPGFTYTADATSGMADLTGYPDGEPLLSGTVVDPVAGLVGAFSVLSALHRRSRNGEGGLIEVALCDAAALLSAEAVIAASRPASNTPTRTGNRSPHAVPQGTYRAADGGWVAVSVATEIQWAGLARAAGWAAAREPDLATVAGRQARHDDVDARLRTWCGQAPATEVVRTLRAAGVPAAEVVAGPGLVEHPQLLARDRVVTVDHPVVGPLRYIGSPIRSSAAPAAPVPRPCPLFGEHNAEVLTELGFSADDLTLLSDRKVIGDSPFGMPKRPAR